MRAVLLAAIAYMSVSDELKGFFACVDGSDDRVMSVPQQKDILGPFFNCPHNACFFRQQLVTHCQLSLGWQLSRIFGGLAVGCLLQPVSALVNQLGRVPLGLPAQSDVPHTVIVDQAEDPPLGAVPLEIVELSPAARLCRVAGGRSGRCRWGDAGLGLTRSIACLEGLHRSTLQDRPLLVEIAGGRVPCGETLGEPGLELCQVSGLLSAKGRPEEVSQESLVPGQVAQFLAGVGVVQLTPVEHVFFERVGQLADFGHQANQTVDCPRRPAETLQQLGGDRGLSPQSAALVIADGGIGGRSLHATRTIALRNLDSNASTSWARPHRQIVEPGGEALTV